MSAARTGPSIRDRTKRAYLFSAFSVVTSCNGFGCPQLLYTSIDKPPMLPRLDPIPAIGGLSAERCGLCHRAIYDEWRSSLMAKAAVDPFFQAERAERGNLFFCGRCHHPLENQEPMIVESLRSIDPLVPKAHANDAYDELLRSEGVTCVVCHMSADAQSYPDAPTRGPPTIYNSRALSDAAAPHPLAVGSALDEDGRVCARCHQFDPLGSKTARPPLDTMAEYALYRRSGGERTCIGCHMPSMARRSVESAPVRSGHDHRFRGAFDSAFIAGALGAKIAPAANGIAIVVENRAGHRLPTGEPARVLRVTIEILHEGRPAASRVLRIVRDFDPIALVDRLDSSLSVGEKRHLRVAFTQAELADADGARLVVDLLRYEPDHPTAHRSGADTPLFTHVLTASCAIGRPLRRG
jgi:hypothetical protein